MLPMILCAILLMTGVMSLAWWIVMRIRNAGVVDPLWTFGLGAVGLLLCLWPLAGDGITARAGLVAAMILLWSGRLGSYLWQRNIGAAEDARYTALRTEWGDAFNRRLFNFLMAQAGAGLLLAPAIALAARNPHPLGLIDALGVAVMLLGLGGGWLADRQMRQFKLDPANRGRVCDVGLWSRSRHPNYVAELIVWCSYPLLAVSGGWWPGLLAVTAPLLMYYLLRHVSGVPLLEAHMARRYGDAFADYAARTPVFLPRLFGGR